MDGVATVKSFDELKAANADASVTKIIAKTTVTINQDFETTKDLWVDGTVKASGQITVKLKNLSAETIMGNQLMASEGATISIDGTVGMVQLITQNPNAYLWFIGTKNAKMTFDSEAGVAGYIDGIDVIGSSNFKLGDMRVGTVGAYVIRIRITVQLRGIKTL